MERRQANSTLEPESRQGQGTVASSKSAKEIWNKGLSKSGPEKEEHPKEGVAQDGIGSTGTQLARRKETSRR